MHKLAIITTHPIQYNAPLFRLLSERKRIAVKVFYTWEQSKEAVYDARFGIERSWDIPLLEGYESVFVNNTSRKPDSNRFWGIVNPGLYQRLKEEQFDAVLVYRWSVWSHFLLLQRLGKRPALFFRGDSHLLQQGKGVKGMLKDMLLRFVYRKVDAAFVVGTHNKAYMQHYGLKEEQLIPAYHAVDNNRFMVDAERMEQQAKEERRRLAIPEDAVVFLYAGKFYALKQLDLLIRAFQQLPGAHYRLLLTGNGEQENDLKQAARGDNRILFQPFRNQSEMPWVYRMGDVFVLPSNSETWGLGVNEAMACGRAAIVSDRCGCAPDLIRAGANGYVFRSGDELSLLHSLQAFADKQTTVEMGRKALAIITEFSLEAVAEAIEERLGDKGVEEGKEG
ncbi:glycosyltransferase involved in cell wall biosynthesis [Lacibacter cauensis]|uniref:Glycosyltransferase involved in cell wall biosynthesis n=1 Tax=Lacibacter cauensis TaxID=510947 RepID=A0A562SJW4_9BACT|nr:glycosyltransferase family 4 protein [Lacibacter cauensis]TWI81393.1 glycosyltransferase involved in cell wall biosynthesis [Lacibacter cauensis]